jgi:hypothetical protein
MISKACDPPSAPPMIAPFSNIYSRRFASPVGRPASDGLFRHYTFHNGMAYHHNFRTRLGQWYRAP